MGITKYSIQPSSIDHFIINSWAGMNFNAVIIDIHPRLWSVNRNMQMYSFRCEYIAFIEAGIEVDPSLEYVKWDPEKRCIVR